MIRKDHQHHTPQEVAGYLDTALAIVKDADVPDDWKRDTFLKAVDLLAGKQIVFTESSLPPVMAIPRNARH